MEAKLQEAKQLLKAGKKTAAKIALKQKHMLDTQIEQLHHRHTRVVHEMMTLEDATLTVETMTATQASVAAQKKMLGRHNVGSIDTLKDDMETVYDQLREVNDIMAESAAEVSTVDDDMLNEELAQLEAEGLDRELLRPAAVPAATGMGGVLQQERDQVAEEAFELPNVPDTPITDAQTEEIIAEMERELA